MKKIAISFFAIAFSIASIGISTGHAAGTSTLTVSPTNVGVATGKNFTLSLLVDPSGSSLDTARVELRYDATKLEVLAFDLGNSFPYLSPSNYIDNINGELSYGVFKFGEPVTKSGTLATVTFRALSAGFSNVTVHSSSKLIQDGVEKLDATKLGSSTVSVVGDTVKAQNPTTTEILKIAPAPVAQTPVVVAPIVPAPDTSKSLEQQALVYFGAFYGRMPSSGDDWSALKCIANGGCSKTPQDVSAEKSALSTFTKKYGKIPTSSMEWNVIHTLAYTNFLKTDDKAVVTPAPVVKEEVKKEEPKVEVKEEVKTVVKAEKSLEEQALVYFGAFYGRMPSSSDDWSALKCIANGGCSKTPQDVSAEKSALVTFGAKYGKMPASQMEWNVIHTLAYTNFLSTGKKVAVTPAPVVKEEVKVEVKSGEAGSGSAGEEVKTVVVTELTAEQKAVGWFGKLKGYLPGTNATTSEADWKAVDYMVNGYKPASQNVDKESNAITVFSKTFGRLPSSGSDWNIIAAIAYSGAF